MKYLMLVMAVMVVGMGCDAPLNRVLTNSEIIYETKICADAGLKAKPVWSGEFSANFGIEKIICVP